jgi:alpha-glucosidase
MDGGESTLVGTKEFCRLAGELGFEYNVVEGYWSRWNDEEIKDLVQYARQRGVGLWFWKHSRGLRTPEEREEFFKKLQHLGVVGAKIDFFDHEHKEVIDVYQALLKSAAEHKILVDFHGSNKPTGESRTWPNELTREAIRGMESSKLADRATHDATLPLYGHALWRATRQHHVGAPDCMRGGFHGPTAHLRCEPDEYLAQPGRRTDQEHPQRVGRNDRFASV